MAASSEAQETIGNYVIERPLASGSMGHVYVARHSLTYARVALKVLREDLAADAQAEERFLREIRAAAQIGHDGIVKVHDAGRTQDGRLYLAMELLRGETLEDRIDREAGQRLALMDWLLFALEPLTAAHAQGIIHRDLKPANVFIARAADGSEQIKLLDFGLARDTRQKSGTETGITLGTPHYMSPEQATRPKLVGPATDVWSMGVMMYEVLSGHMPFDGETLHAVVIQAATLPHKPLAERVPTLDARLCALVEDCLSKDISARPPDAELLRMRLEPLLRDERLRDELRDPVEHAGAVRGEGADMTPEQVPYADTISGLPLRLFDDSRESRVPKKRRESRRGLWLSTLALSVLAALAFVWLGRAKQQAPEVVSPAPVVAPVAATTAVTALPEEPKRAAPTAARATPVRKPRPSRTQPTAASAASEEPRQAEPSGEPSAAQIAKDAVHQVQDLEVEGRLGETDLNAATEPAPSTAPPSAASESALPPAFVPSPSDMLPQDPAPIAPLPELPEPPDPGSSAP